MKQKHVVVFVHGWNGKPWPERFFEQFQRGRILSTYHTLGVFLLKI